MGDVSQRLRDKSHVEPFANQGEIEYRQSLYHQAAEHIKTLEARVQELEGALREVHDDLLMRATKDSKGCKIVDVGASCWLRICAALQEE